MYPCIPDYAKVTPKDPFDYPLRSKEEVIHEFKYMPAEFEIDVELKR